MHSIPSLRRIPKARYNSTGSNGHSGNSFEGKKQQQRQHQSPPRHQGQGQDQGQGQGQGQGLRLRLRQDSRGLRSSRDEEEDGAARRAMLKEYEVLQYKN